MQAPVVGERADRVLDDFELACVHREAVQHDRAEHDPGNWEQPVRRAIQRRQDREFEGHAVGAECDDQRRAERGERRHPGRLAQDAQHEEQRHNRDGGDEGRHAQTRAYRFIVVLPHRRELPKE